MILPGKISGTQHTLPHVEALNHTVLTFWDAEGVRWVRLPGGRFQEQTYPTVHDSVLDALGEQVPGPPESARPRRRLWLRRS